MPKMTQDRVLGLVALALGLFIALYWAGADSETGLVERVRGRSNIGDALAPTVAGAILATSGLWLFITGRDTTSGLYLSSLWFVGALFVVLLTALLLMRWGGPGLVEVVTGAEYRPQRDTAPWKYVGYILGGTLLVAGLIWLVERRLRWSRLFLALGVSVFLALFYDLPFEDLLLPPNGDV